MDSIEQYVKEQMKRPFGESDIKILLNGKIKILTYNSLESFDTIEQLLHPFGRVVLLYEWKKNFGHWVCVFYAPNHRIEFFDPYGYKPDGEKSFIPPKLWRMGYLSQLLYDASNRGWIIEYNQYKFQKKGNDISTCGRWVVLRLLFQNYTLEEFHKIFQNLGDVHSDDLVTFLTEILLNKSKF